MKRIKMAIVPILFIMLLAGCTQTGAKTGIDQAIQFRSAFNTLLAQFNTELSVMPPEQQKIWAQKAVPFMQAGVLALNTMDIAAGAGTSVSPETIQQYLTAKNQMIDLTASLILAKKGGK
jgi:hypothetical protein